MFIVLFILLLCSPVEAQELTELTAIKETTLIDIAKLEEEKNVIDLDIKTDEYAEALSRLKSKADERKVKDDAIKAKLLIVTDMNSQIAAYK